jgi:hypothetical protein
VLVVGDWAVRGEIVGGVVETGPALGGMDVDDGWVVRDWDDSGGPVGGDKETGASVCGIRDALGNWVGGRVEIEIPDGASDSGNVVDLPEDALDLCKRRTMITINPIRIAITDSTV